MRSLLWIVMPLAIGVSIGTSNGQLHAQLDPKGADQITKTLSDWANRHERFKSVRYVVRGEIEQKNLPAGSKLSPKRPVKYVVLLDFVHGRSRIEKNSSGRAASQDRYIPRVGITAYDGTTHQQSVDRKLCELGPKNPDVCLVKGPLDLMPIDHYVWPVLFAHGVVPTVNKPARPDRLPVEHTADEFELRGEIRHAGNGCIVLRTDPAASTPFLVDEFWIDPAKDSAIARHTYFAGKNPWFQFDITYQNSERGWMPLSWIFAHSKGNKLIEVVHFTVEQLEANPTVTNDDFVLPISPGSIVQTQNFPEPGKGLDPLKPANGSFRVAADGKWITLEESGFTTAEGMPLPPEPRNQRWVWWTYASLIGIAGFAIAVLFYRLRMRRLTSR